MKIKASLPAAALLLLTVPSCDVRERAGRDETPSPIEFRITYCGGTKAVSETSLSSLQSGFRVKAARRGDASSFLYTGDAVPVPGSQDRFTFSSPRYYPSTGALHFFAVYPPSAGLAEDFSDGDSDGNADCRLSFTDDGSSAPLQDVVAAVNATGAHPGDVVSLDFTHVLSRIGSITFRVGMPGDFLVTPQVTVTSMTARVPSSGVLTLGTAGGPAWSANGTLYAYPLAAGVSGISAPSPVTVTQDRLFIPASAPVQFTVVYSVTVSGVTVGPYTRSATASVPCGQTTNITVTLPADSSSGSVLTVEPYPAETRIPDVLL